MLLGEVTAGDASREPSSRRGVGGVGLVGLADGCGHPDRTRFSGIDVWVK